MDIFEGVVKRFAESIAEGSAKGISTGVVEKVL